MSKLGKILKTLNMEAMPSSTKSRIQAFGRNYDKAVIETMSRLGYDTETVYEGLITNNKAILDPYNRMVEEKRRAEEF